MNISELETLLPQKNSWESLIEDFEDSKDLGTPAITNIFQNYTMHANRANIPLPSCFSKRFVQINKFHSQAMIHTICELYLKWNLLLKKGKIDENEKRIIISKIEVLVNFLYVITDDLNFLNVFQDEFDPLWKLSYCIFEYQLKTKFDRIFDSSISRYLLVDRLNKQIADEEAKVSQDILKKQRMRPLTLLNPKSDEFCPGAYYYILLNYHEELIQVFPTLIDLFFELPDREKENLKPNPLNSSASSPAVSRPPLVKPPPRYQSSPAVAQKQRSQKEAKKERKSLGITAKILSDTLFTNSEKSIICFLQKFEKILQYRITEKKKGLFPNLQKKMEEYETSASQVAPLCEDNPLKLLFQKEEPLFIFAENIFRRNLFHDPFNLCSPEKQRELHQYLCHNHLIKILPLVIKSLKLKFSESKDELIQELTIFTQKIFKIPSSTEQFQKIMKILANAIKEIPNRKKMLFRKSWQTLFNEFITSAKYKRYIELIIADINTK